jgi:hypothetical protein
MILAIKTFPTTEMIALAYAVDRLNGGYVKFNDAHKKSNKDLFMEQIYREIYRQDKSYSQIKPIVITDQDRANAQSVEYKLKHLVLDSIKGFKNTFESNIYRSIFSETVTQANLALICFVPEYVRRETEKRATTRVVIKNYSESQWIRNSKDAVGTASILRCIWLSNFEKYMYVAATESGNLIRFYIREQFDVGSQLRITSCKIKAHETDQETRMPTTVLNFVRYKNK